MPFRPLATAGLAALLSLTAITAASAQAWVARHGMSGASYQAEFNKYTSQGYRLSDVAGYAVNGQARYAAIWTKTGGPAWAARHGMNAGSYQNAFNAITSQGYGASMVSAYTVSGTPYFAALWTKGTGAFVARHGLSGSGYQTEFTKWAGQGYRLVSVTGYEQGGKARYAAVWQKKSGPAWVARHGMTGAAYQAAFNQYTAQGFKPAQVSAYTVGGKIYYAAIWEKKPGAYVARHGMTPAAYQAEFNTWTAKGYRLHDVSAATAGGTPRFAAIWVK